MEHDTTTQTRCAECGGEMVPNPHDADLAQCCECGARTGGW